ncbi:MAG TPA: hypothetical protein VI356_26725 [Myxococcales bacterium]
MRLARAVKMMRRRFVAVLACAADLLLAGRASAWTRDRIAFVVQNQSTNPAAAEDMAPLVRDLLVKKRYETVDLLEFADALKGDAAGVAPAAVKSAADARKLDGIVSITVELFLDAKDREKGPNASPVIGMSARMYAPDGRVVWRNSVAVIAEQSIAVSQTRYAITRGRASRGSRPAPAANPPAGEEPKISAASVASELLLWTLPLGRPSPEELARMRAPEAPPGPAFEPLKATRLEGSPGRAREFEGVARFPMRTDRSIRKLLETPAPRS